MKQAERFYVIARKGGCRSVLRVMVTVLFASVILTPPSTKAEAQPICDGLKSFIFPHTTIANVILHPGGKYNPVDGSRIRFADLPPSCQVTANIQPTEDAAIKVQVWLPIQRYNSRYLGTGNGGYGGAILDSELAQGINNGFATANTDLGTCAGCGLMDQNNQLVGHSEKWRDFGWLSTHMMTNFSKALIKEFYGTPASYSYFAGCSTGGQQALMEATRFPDDYDGILAGAPAFNRTHLHMLLVSQYKATHRQPETGIAQRTLKTETPTTDANAHELSFLGALLEAEQRAKSFEIQRAPGEQTSSSEELRKKLDAVNIAVRKACRGEPKADELPNGSTRVQIRAKDASVP